MKTCTKCGLFKPFSSFSPNGPRIRSRCKPCRSKEVCEYVKRNSDKHNARLRKWRVERKEVARSISKRYYLKNKAEKLASVARRRAAIRTPRWAQLNKIKEFYKLARHLTESTGIRHSVDHIIPLRGKNVCGLHVETNLQILTLSENTRKHNRFIDV